MLPLKVKQLTVKFEKLLFNFVQLSPLFAYMYTP
jgi:hypothetical protein